MVAVALGCQPLVGGARRAAPARAISLPRAARAAAAPLRPAPARRRRAAGAAAVPPPRASASPGGGGPPPRRAEFGYSRKDVLLIGAGLFGAGFGLYYGLQAAGLDAAAAGNWAQLAIFVGLCFGWVGSYLFRVANKDMTYVKQLADYEEAVMLKRLEEMPEKEREALLEAAAKGGQGGEGGGE